MNSNTYWSIVEHVEDIAMLIDRNSLGEDDTILRMVGDGKDLLKVCFQ